MLVVVLSQMLRIVVCRVCFDGIGVLLNSRLESIAGADGIFFSKLVYVRVFSSGYRVRL